MVCKTTSIRRQSGSASPGFTLAEILIAVGITGILMVALASLVMFTGRSFAAMFNYADLSDANRIAIDTMTRDLRGCNRIISCTTTRLQIEDSDGTTLTYEYFPQTETVTRTQNGNTKTMMTGCDSLTFRLGTRNPINGTFDVVPTTDVSEAKVVNVAWNCARVILGHKVNTEAVQTARIVIRKQGS